MSLRQQLKCFPILVGIIALTLGVCVSMSVGHRETYSERRPNSIHSNDSLSFAQFDIGCVQRVVAFQTSSNQVRLRGCLGLLGAPVKIVNESTSVELTVLENEEMFTTDYFKLKPSKNFLKVSYKDNSELSIPITLNAAAISK